MPSLWPPGTVCQRGPWAWAQSNASSWHCAYDTSNFLNYVQLTVMHVLICFGFCMFDFCTYPRLSCCCFLLRRCLDTTGFTENTTRFLLLPVQFVLILSPGVVFSLMSGHRFWMHHRFFPFSYFSKALGLQDTENHLWFQCNQTQVPCFVLFYQYNYCNMTCNCSIKSIVMTSASTSCVFMKKCLCEVTRHTSV